MQTTLQTQCSESAPILYILFGNTVAGIHAQLLYTTTTTYKNDIHGTILLLFMSCACALYISLLGMLKCFKIIYIKIALVVWPLSFYIMSIMMLHLENIGTKEVIVTYCLYLVYFSIFVGYYLY